ncbi:MAG: HAD family hydrolase [Clostridia bacterium]|nr:HAD family hydrolase [Clostridia bacterium]
MKAILFDMDGTLLPMEQEDFTRLYFHGILSYCAPLGLAPDRMKEMLRASIKAMVKNDGTVTNAVRFEEVFQAYFPGKEAEMQQIAGYYTISEPNSQRFFERNRRDTASDCSSYASMRSQSSLSR